MNKKELVNEVATKTEMTKKDTNVLVDALFDTITEQLVDGEPVAVTGFGKFETANREARKGHNPSTGEAIDIAAKTIPKFKAGKQLKESVNQ